MKRVLGRRKGDGMLARMARVGEEEETRVVLERGLPASPCCV